MVELVRRSDKAASSERQTRFFQHAGITKFERPMGPSPIQALASREGEDFIREYMETTFAKRAEHQILRAFSK